MIDLNTRKKDVGDSFQSFDNWRKISLNSRLKLKSISRYQIMTRDNDSKYNVGLVLSGVLGVKRTLSDGRWIYYSLIQSGDFFDLRQHNQKSESQLCALGDAMILGFNENKFDEALSLCPDIYDIYQTELKKQLSSAREHLIDIALKTPVERLASAIFEFKEWSCSKAATVTLPIIRRDLAHYLSLTPETLSRVIQQIQNEKLITIIKNNTLYLNDAPKLSQIANGSRPRKRKSC